MLKVTQERIDQNERDYPGFRELLEHWEAKELPPCPLCGSVDTAEVSAGLVGLSMRLAGATTKIRLLPNRHPADYFCNRCQRYFDGPDRPHGEPKRASGGITFAGKDVVEAAKTPEGLQALYEEMCAALGIEPVHDAEDDGEEPSGAHAESTD